MKKLIIIMVCWLPLVSMAQEIVELWPDKIPNSRHTLKTDTLKENPTIAVFLPSKRIANGLGVVICPGGSYSWLAYEHEGTDLAKFFNGRGVAAFVLKYRLPNAKNDIEQHKSPLLDAKRAMEIVRAGAEKWNLDPSKIGIVGSSAGGHLASTLGTHFESENRPDFMILLYPVVTMKGDYTHFGSRKNLLGENPSDEMVTQYSNELQVKENTPPTFIVHCADDRTVPVENSLQLVSALRKKKVPVELHVYPKGGHGFGLALNKPRLKNWSNLMIEWLEDLSRIK
ncbi:alpha/beta hydrolase [Yeosuana marina]|uniref:alpha/beta hydrolase n=1 Tax=Yeosuana marina TaxID=1565536 RepID=UPI0030C8B65C